MMNLSAFSLNQPNMRHRPTFFAFIAILILSFLALALNVLITQPQEQSAHTIEIEKHGQDRSEASPATWKFELPFIDRGVRVAQRVPNVENRQGDKIALMDRATCKTSFPGRHWRDVAAIADHSKLIAKITEIRAARDYLLHQNGEKRYENRFRYMICTITRNEGRLKEWIIRNFMNGVEHMVIYDNNRVHLGLDRNISDVLQPFIEAGIVTHERWPQSETHPAWNQMSDSLKYNFWAECLQQYGPWTDWFIPIDTDEYVMHWTQGEGNPLDPTKRANRAGIGSDLVHDYPYEIWPLHQVMKRLGSNISAYSLRWFMPYNNHTMLRSNRSLLESFPVSCVLDHSYGKFIVRPERLWKITNHRLSTHGAQIHTVLGTTKVGEPGEGGAILHYYSKSVEEWIVKKELSYREYKRYMWTIYDAPKWRRWCNFATIIYPPGYHEAVALMMRLAADVPDGGQQLRPYVALYESDPDYTLYLFLKWAIAERLEWDEESYHQLHPELQALIDSSHNSTVAPKNIFIDGLDYFLRVGFQNRTTSCWKQMKKSEQPKMCF